MSGRGGFVPQEVLDSREIGVERRKLAGKKAHQPCVWLWKRINEGAVPREHTDATLTDNTFEWVHRTYGAGSESGYSTAYEVQLDPSDGSDLDEAAFIVSNWSPGAEDTTRISWNVVP